MSKSGCWRCRTRELASDRWLNSARSRLTGLRGEASHPFQNRAHGDSAGTARDVWFRFVNPRQAGNVEMNPRGVFGENLQEFRRGAGSAIAAAGIFDVGDIGLD